jgi:DNA-binding beta-propeller fold protein YncE
MTLAIRRAGALCLAACLQMSCGDGGGGGNEPPPPPPPPPTSTEALLTEQAAHEAAFQSFYPAEDAYYAMLLLTQAAQELQRNQMAPLNFDCSQGGTVSLTADDANGNGSLESGDRIAITYAACNDAVTGPYTLDVTDATFSSGAVTALAGAAALDFTFNAAAATTLTGSGTMAFNATSTDLTWLGTGFRIDFRRGVDRDSLSGARIERIYNQDSTYSFAFAGTVESAQLGGRFETRTGPPFRGVEGQWPTTGVLTATGRNDSEVRFLADGGSEFVKYEVDADGDGVIDDVAESTDWADVSSGVGFGVFDDPDSPPPPPPPELLGRRIALGESAKDLAVNPLRGHIYVTIPAQHELLVFSASTLEVVRRVHLGSRPFGLSVSPDGDEIFVGLAASGAIAILDADDFTETRIFVAPELESVEVYKVVETAPGILYVSTGIPFAQGRMARVDRVSGVVTPIATTAYADIELLADPARNVLYVGDGVQLVNATVVALDASIADTPILHSRALGPGNGQTHRLSLDPSGSRLYLASGDVLNTNDFSRIGRVEFGVPSASDNGTEVFVARGAVDLEVYSAASLRQIDAFETDCSQSEQGSDFREVQRLMPSPVNGQWLLLGDEVLCVVDTLNPDVPPGTGEPGVLPEPLPTTTITTETVLWGGAMVDAEYDEARNRLYLSMYSGQELFTVDVESLSVVERQDVGHTVRGLDLSPDGSTLAMMFSDSGRIAFKDLASGTIETQDLADLLGTVAGHDVQWWNDDVLFASADPPCCEEPMNAHIVRVSRSDPDASRRSGGGASDFRASQLAISPDRNFLYLNRYDEVVKLDLNQPGEPVVLARVQGEPGRGVGGFDQASISPDGERVVFANGRILRTADLFQAGELGRVTRSLFSADGTIIYGALGLWIDLYDPTSFQALERLAPSGNCSPPIRFFKSADEQLMITAEQNRACIWRLDQPIATTLKAKPHDPYACGPACMLRNVRKKSRADVRQAPGSRGNEAGLHRIQP